MSAQESVPLVRQIAAVQRMIDHLNGTYDKLIARGDREGAEGAGDILRDLYELQAVRATLQKIHSQQNPQFGFTT